MSWQQVAGENVHAHASPVESQRFGRQVERITAGALSAGTNTDIVDEVLEMVCASSADLVIVRVPSRAVSMASRAHRWGFSPLFCGTLIYWGAGLPLDHESLPVSDDWLIRTRSAGDITNEERRAAVALLPDIFAGYTNHYSFNPTLPPRVVEEGYQDWATRTLSSPEGLVTTAAVADEVVAVASWRIEGDVGEIELAGVKAAARRRGAYTALFADILRVATAREVTTLVISTQADNTSVQSAWARIGLVPLLAVDTFHFAGGAR
jgi:ribosomal protein S18 acetylase RimI-like enzyme